MGNPEHSNTAQDDLAIDITQRILADWSKYIGAREGGFQIIIDVGPKVRRAIIKWPAPESIIDTRIK